jgi:hypothetical protein
MLSTNVFCQKNITYRLGQRFTDYWSRLITDLVWNSPDLRLLDVKRRALITELPARRIDIPRRAILQYKLCY